MSDPIVIVPNRIEISTDRGATWQSLPAMPAAEWHYTPEPLPSPPMPAFSLRAVSASFILRQTLRQNQVMRHLFGLSLSREGRRRHHKELKRRRHR